MLPQEDGTLLHVLEDAAVLECMLRPISGQEPRERDDLVRGVAQ